MEYNQSGVISVLLKEQVNIEELVKEYSNLQIRMAKSIDKEVIGVETLKC